MSSLGEHGHEIDAMLSLEYLDGIGTDARIGIVQYVVKESIWRQGSDLGEKRDSLGSNFGIRIAAELQKGGEDLIAEGEVLGDLYGFDSIRHRTGAESPLEPMNGVGEGLEHGKSCGLAGGFVESIATLPEMVESDLPDARRDDATDGVGAVGHQLDEGGLIVSGLAANELPGRHTGQSLVGIAKERAEQSGGRCPRPLHGEPQEAKSASEIVLQLQSELIQSLVLNGFVHTGSGNPVADASGVEVFASCEVFVEFSRFPP